MGERVGRFVAAIDGLVDGIQLGLKVVGNVEGVAIGKLLGANDGVLGCGVGLRDGCLEGRLKTIKKIDRQSGQGRARQTDMCETTIMTTNNEKV